jgi:membrane protein required for colicin V production
MEFSYFDLVASIIILFLGLKGIINGFFKEVFGLVGIVGGIFVASRVGDSVGKLISDLVFKFDNSAAISFTGFLVTFALFWILMVIAGYAFKKLSSLSGLGPLDKILGFVFGASKFFLIAAVIAHAAYNINAIKTTVDSSMKNSILFPILVETGSFIMKLDPVKVSKDINSTTKKVQSKINEAVDSSTKAMIDDAKKQIKESMPEKAKEITTDKDGNA